jgi:putative aldouronate transport system substrate-binding protein
MVFFAIALAGMITAGAFATGAGETGGTGEASFESAPVVDIYWDGDVGAKLQEMGIDLEDNVWYQYVYEQTGVRPLFTWIPAQGYFEKMRLVTASREEFDLFRGDRVVNWIRNRSIAQLDDLLEQHGQDILKTVPEAAIAKVTYRGDIYGIPIPEHRIVKQVLLIRADWFDQLGMDAPETIAEFEQFLRAVRGTDLNGNGEPDEYGLTMDKDWSDTFLFTGAWGAAPNWGDGGTFVDFEDRQIKLWAATDDAREYFATFARWWDEGLIDPESLSQDRYSGQKSKFTGGTAATYRDSILDAVTYEGDLTKLLGPGPHVIPLPPLRGTDRAG